MFEFVLKEKRGLKQETAVVIIFILSAFVLLSVHLSVTSKEQVKLEQTNVSGLIRRLPGAIIIGSRKSGTRALLKFLQLNPAVKSAKREIHFFDRPRNYKKGLSWYASQMPFSSSNEVTIEKSPAYFVTQGVPEKVNEMNSSIRLILILRDPVTRLISDYSQLVANKIELGMQVLEEEEDNKDLMADGDYNSNNSDSTTGLSDNSIASIWSKAEKAFEVYVKRQDGGIDDQRRAIKIGMYSNYLEKWRSLFPLKQFHFVDGELLISKPYEELRKLESFLGLKPVIQETDFVFNERKGFFCLSNRGDNLFKNASNCLSRSKGRRHVVVNNNLIQELRKFYAPYNEYLYSLTGRNFSWPNQ